MDSGPLPAEQHLAVHAAATLELIAAPDRPSCWNTPAFVRELALVRAHLAPIRSRALLVALFGRESVHDEADCSSLERITSRLRVSAVQGDRSSPHSRV